LYTMEEVIEGKDYSFPNEELKVLNSHQFCTDVTSVDSMQ
jgi:hypothetical protein